ncbi:Predicted arabinose efflux permease, MFS family [Desulfotomaculum arcticum]|uniref:Predicted arabinose efflux permease, MFS family n=1 Tax=Desulfotruncus arcticus DSM 17038 TaxID=1121424 RepID=A0A1I2UWP3_9FIRM|nr:MFS transporter [Desulfotruncus arcticus]SFG81480.1 Predicted arabinose efflux permease, MFS family [Desulfotomaculum arcticum] [Desulfotruncus arcticus DSM 17038]
MYKKLLLILGLAGFTVMADNWVVSPILPSIAQNINIPVTRAGLLITAYMIPFGLFQLVFGPLADRYGKRQVINTTMLLFTFATALCAIGVSLTDLAIYRALTGIFAASIMPVSLALIGDVVPMPQRQSAIGTFMGISFLGQGLSMAIGGTIAYFVSWRGVFIIYAGLAVVSTVLLFTAGRKIPSAKNPNSRLLAPYWRLLTNKDSALTYLVVLIEGILIIGSFSYLGAFIEHLYHYNNLYIGLMMTAFGVLAVIGGRLSGKLAAKMGRKRVLSLGLLSATLADVIFYLYGSQLIVLAIGIGLLGLGFMLAHSTLLTIATEFAPQARGTVMSLVAFCFMGGGGLGTALGGRLIAAHSYTWFFSAYALCLALLILLAWLVVPGMVARQQPQPQPGSAK